MSDYYACGGACKLCTAARSRERYAVRPPEQVERKRNNLKSYAQRNKERVLERAAFQRTTPQFKEWCKAYRARTKEQRRARDKEYYAKNREQILAYQAEWQRANPDKCREYSQKNLAKPGVRERSVARAKHTRNTLTDGYVRTVLSFRTILEPEDVPQDMVEAKRVQLQIKRKIKNGTNT